MAHSMVYGSWEPTPWRAVNRAAWQGIDEPTAGCRTELEASPAQDGPPALRREPEVV